MPDMVTRADIDGARMVRRLRDLAVIGRQPTGGISRPGFSAADRQAHQYLMQLASSSGLQPSVDAAANLLIRQQPARAGRHALMLGSHLDTVVDGGWLDGAYGVIAALEVLQTCDEAGVDPGFDLVAVAFANEEAALFPQPFWGSMVAAGMLGALPDDPTDYQGSPLAPALAAMGGSLPDLDRAVWPRDEILGYLELHIEQGPVLESLGAQVGVVDSIAGRWVFDVVLSGVAGHAGTTPMAHRHDPVLGAAHVILLVEELARTNGLCKAATVGRVQPFPNSANTIAGRVRLTIDLRDSESRRLAAARSALEGGIANIAAGLGLDVRCELTTDSPPTPADGSIRQHIADSADRLGIPHHTLPSGAGHDAQVIATVAPVGMIFAPSIGGLSHVPQEDTATEDLIAGARVLLATVLRMADR